MTATDWLGVLGVLMVAGSITIAALLLACAIVQDARRALELRATERQDAADREAVDAALERELAEILSPFEQRHLRVVDGGRGGDAA